MNMVAMIPIVGTGVGRLNVATTPTLGAGTAVRVVVTVTVSVLAVVVTEVTVSVASADTVVDRSVVVEAVVLVDAFLNDMNSFDFLRQFRDGHTPVVIMSTSSTCDIERSAMQNGAAAFLAASEDPETIDFLIERVVRVAVDLDHTH